MKEDGNIAGDWEHVDGEVVIGNEGGRNMAEIESISKFPRNVTIVPPPLFAVTVGLLTVA